MDLFSWKMLVFGSVFLRFVLFRAEVPGAGEEILVGDTGG